MSSNIYLLQIIICWRKIEEVTYVNEILMTEWMDVQWMYKLVFVYYSVRTTLFLEDFQ